MTKALKKIAILGSAPSSVSLAPFADTSWQIWACSPGCYPVAKRVDRWVELHRWEPGQPWFSVEYIKFMANLSGPVYMIEPVAEIPNSVMYPLDQVMNHVYGYMVDLKGVWREKRFDRSDFSSSIAWMIALAIVEGADEIGLWGVDMSACEEWAFQRSGCQSLIDAAKSVGITVRVPCESDLLRPPPLYGFCEIDPAHIKAIARRNELLARINNAIANGQNAQREADHMRGALDQHEYVMKTWVGNPFHLAQDTHVVVPPQFDGSSAAIIPPLPGQPPEPDADWRTLEAELNGSVGGVVTAAATLRPVSPPVISASTLAELDHALNGAAVDHVAQ